MINIKEYLNVLTRRQSQLKADLAEFERGDLQIASRQMSTDVWKDETEVIVEHYKQQIAHCDRMIAMLDKTLNELATATSAQ